MATYSQSVSQSVNSYDTYLSMGLRGGGQNDEANDDLSIGNTKGPGNRHHDSGTRRVPAKSRGHYPARVTGNRRVLREPTET